MVPKIYAKNARMSEGGFTLDQIMQLHINFYELTLTRGSYHVELSEWIERKKEVINPKDNDELHSKWVVIAASHHKEIAKDP